jgi:hypothetical protein
MRYFSMAFQPTWCGHSEDSCGFIEELLDYWLDARLDCVQSLEVAAGNDLARIRGKVRDKMALIGGLDSSRIITFGTPAE